MKYLYTHHMAHCAALPLPQFTRRERIKIALFSYAVQDQTGREENELIQRLATKQED